MHRTLLLMVLIIIFLNSHAQDKEIQQLNARIYALEKNFLVRDSIYL